MKYRSKRVRLMVEQCLSGELTCDKEGNIFRNGRIVKEHFDYDGYRAIYVKGVEIPCHQVITYLKFDVDSIKKGIVTRHLNGNKLDNTWENIAIGTPADNRSDISPEIRSQAIVKKWRGKTLAERSEMMKNLAKKISPEKRKRRGRRAAKAMTFDDRSKAHKSRNIIISDEINNQLIYLKDDYTINDLSRFFDLPLSKVRQAIGI